MEFLTVETPEVATMQLQAEMERFCKSKSQPAKISQFAWENIWRELVNVGIYRRGPDIAEIGSTWLDGLAAMRSLYPFSAHDIYQIGGKEVFFPAIWQNVAVANQDQIWGIPFRADTRVVFYWKDLFEKASVDQAEAFSTAENMTAAFTRLQEAGIPAWIAPTNNSHDTVYNIASWIWGAGGDFLTPDEKHTAFNSAPARRGIQAYFDLLRFMPKQTSPFTDADMLRLFFARQAASAVAGPWLLNTLRLKENAAELMPHLGIARLPGPSFVGGTLLIIWQHAKSLFDAIELIRRFTGPEFQAKYCQISGLLPVRQDLWTDEFIHSDPYLPIFNQAIRAGRALPPISLWGIVEDHLANTLAAVWRDLYALNMPGKPIDTLNEIIGRRFEALARNLDMTLSTPNEALDDF